MRCSIIFCGSVLCVFGWLTAAAVAGNLHLQDVHPEYQLASEFHFTMDDLSYKSDPLDDVFFEKLPTASEDVRSAATMNKGQPFAFYHTRWGTDTGLAPTSYSLASSAGLIDHATSSPWNLAMEQKQTSPNGLSYVGWRSFSSGSSRSNLFFGVVAFSSVVAFLALHGVSATAYRTVSFGS